MSRLRHNSQIDEKSLLIRTLGLKLSKDHVIDSHAHPWAQVIFASRGVMHVDTQNSRWIVPPMRCLWMPANIDHSIRMNTETWMRTIYIRPDLAVFIQEDCNVLNVSPLLREIILETVRLKMLSESVSSEYHLAKVLLNQIALADEMPMKIIMPRDLRALRLAKIFTSNPANRKPLKDLSRTAGASPRTLERIFLKETGLSVGRWRQQVRFMMSVRLLVEGNTVNQVAFACGYENPSAFVAMFKREAGLTPGQYAADLKCKTGLRN